MGRAAGASLGATLVSVALFGSSCTTRAPATPDRGVVVRDSAGVRIVENPSPGALPELAVATEPLLSVDSGPGGDLSGVVAAARLSDGTVVIADEPSHEVRFYGPDGVHKVTVGEQGSGPAELTRPLALLVEQGDTVTVQDTRDLHALPDRVRFAPDGTFLGRVAVEGGLEGVVTGVEYPGLCRWLPDGSLLVTVTHPDAGADPPRPGAPSRASMTFLRVDPALSRVDTLGEFGGILHQYVRLEDGPGGVGMVIPAFAVQTDWDEGAPDGTVLFADNERPGVLLVRGDGARVRVSWRAVRERVTADDLEAWKAEHRARWPEGVLQRLEREWALMDVPEWKPWYGNLVALASDGSVWVPEKSEFFVDPSPWLVFTPDGRLRGRAELPGPFRVLDAGPGWVLGSWHDGEGGDHIRVVRIGT